jgi:hypothetical protein
MEFNQNQVNAQQRASPALSSVCFSDDSRCQQDPEQKSSCVTNLANHQSSKKFSMNYILNDELNDLNVGHMKGGNAEQNYYSPVEIAAQTSSVHWPVAGKFDEYSQTHHVDIFPLPGYYYSSRGNSYDQQTIRSEIPVDDQLTLEECVSPTNEFIEVARECTSIHRPLRSIVASQTDEVRFIDDHEFGDRQLISKDGQVIIGPPTSEEISRAVIPDEVVIVKRNDDKVVPEVSSPLCSNDLAEVNDLSRF